jgi:hypothetical protein
LACRWPALLIYSLILLTQWKSLLTPMQESMLVRSRWMMFPVAGRQVLGLERADKQGQVGVQVAG